MTATTAAARQRPPAFDPANTTRWGVSFSVTPAWKIADSVADFLSEDGEDVTFKGTELTIGFGRGSRNGGDWAVSYVRKPFKDGVAVSSTETFCFQPSPNQPQLCPTSRETKNFEHVFLSGIEVDKFIPFVRIKDRVQIGMNIGGGFGEMKGNIRTVTDDEEPTFIPGTPGKPGTTVLVPVHTEETNPASEELLKYFPLIKLEAEGAVIVAPSFKIKIAGGLNFPSTSFRVLAIYLIGG